MKPVNQNHEKLQNDTFNKINAASQTGVSIMRLLLLCFITLLVFISAALTLFYAAGPSEEINGIFLGHRFSLYHLFQGFFDGLSAIFYNTLPVDGLFYERWARALPGIILVIYCSFFYRFYKKAHPEIQNESLSFEDKYAIDHLRNTLCLVTAIIVCIIACDRGRSASFIPEFWEYISKGVQIPVVPYIIYCIPIFFITYNLCKVLYKPAKMIYSNKDIKNAIISVIIVLVLIIIWLMFNSFYNLVKQFIGVAILIFLSNIIEHLDFVVII